MHKYNLGLYDNKNQNILNKMLKKSPCEIEKIKYTHMSEPANKIIIKLKDGREIVIDVLYDPVFESLG